MLEMTLIDLLLIWNFLGTLLGPWHLYPESPVVIRHCQESPVVVRNFYGDPVSRVGHSVCLKWPLMTLDWPVIFWVQFWNPDTLSLRQLWLLNTFSFLSTFYGDPVSHVGIPYAWNDLYWLPIDLKLSGDTFGTLTPLHWVTCGD